MDEASSERGQRMKLLGRSAPIDGDAEDRNVAQTPRTGDDQPAEGRLNLWQAAFVIAGASSGYGPLASGLLTVSTGWTGVVIYVALWAAMVFTGVLIGRCWNVVNEGRVTGRLLYGAIGQAAFGDRGRMFVNVTVCLASFISTIEVLLATAETTLLLGGDALRGTFCYLPLILTAIICPVFWLATPKDFWWVMAMAYFSVVLSVPFMVTSNLLVALSTPAVDNLTDVVPQLQDLVQETAVQETVSLRLAEAITFILFSSGIHFTLPTIQRDMQEPQRFPQAVVLGLSLSILLTPPIMLSLHIAYGYALTGVTGDMTAMTLMPKGALRTASISLLFVHIFTSGLVTNNPVFQYVEEKLDVPIGFTWKRAAVRTSILLVQVFIQETLPHISVFGNLSVGLLVPVHAFLMPALFHLRLRGRPSTSSTEEKPATSWLETVVCCLLIGLAPFFMATVLFVTVSEMIRGRTVFTVPCYVDPIKAHV